MQTANIHNGTLLYFRPNIPGTNYFHTGGTSFFGNNDSNGGWFTFTGSNHFPQGRVDFGRVAGSTVKVGKLRVYSGATLTVDGATLEVDTADMGLSSVVTWQNGGLFVPSAGTIVTFR